MVPAQRYTSGPYAGSTPSNQRQVKLVLSQYMAIYVSATSAATLAFVRHVAC